jgi:c-di-GMP-binding flagellar brake protein YcgR
MMKKIFLSLKSEQGKIIRGYLLDLSLSGMGVASAKEINAGSRIAISPRGMALPPLAGRVVASRKRKKQRYSHRLGVRFEPLQGSAQRELEGFMARRERRSAGRLKLA